MACPAHVGSVVGEAGGRLRGLVKAEGRMGSWNNNNSATKVWKGEARRKRG